MSLRYINYHRCRQPLTNTDAVVYSYEYNKPNPTRWYVQPPYGDQPVTPIKITFCPFCGIKLDTNVIITDNHPSK